MTKIGITGHRCLESEAVWPWVASQIWNLLKTLPDPLKGFSNMAVGADQLFAELILDRGGELTAILPYDGIESSFSSVELPGYRRLIKRATVLTLGGFSSKEDAYLAAGKSVVDNSLLMIAVWDGKPARGKGGTADIVDYAKMRGRELIHINPLTKAFTRHTL